jgi:hypothetical protein
MVKGQYPLNKYNYNYEPVELEKGHTFAEDLPTARQKLIQFLEDEHGQIDESQLEIEEIVF